jgi:hypothetical protein
MAHTSVGVAGSSTRAPVFVWIAVGLLSALVLGTIAVAALVVPSIVSINRSGGWGWLLIGGMYVAVATFVCLASAICSAISLLRREPRARLATAILLCSALEVWTFRGSLVLLVRGFEEDQNVPIVRAESVLSNALVRHFASSNIILRPGGRDGGFQTGWFLEDADVGPRCEIGVTFRHFPTGTPVETMRKALMGMSPPPVLNEEAALAMFQPNAAARSPNAADCAGWSAKSPEIVERIVNAFRSFQPPVVGDGANSR